MQPDVLFHPRHDFVVSISGTEARHATLKDTSEFLYDLNLIYELARLATDEVYFGFHFSGHATRRNGRPLKPAARLEIRRLSQESPFLLEVAVAAALAAGPAIWALVQALETLYNIPIERKKKRAELEKLERENRVAARKEAVELEQRLDEQARAALSASPATPLIETARRRLSHSSIVITRMSLDVIEHQEPEDD